MPILAFSVRRHEHGRALVGTSEVGQQHEGQTFVIAMLEGQILHQLIHQFGRGQHLIQPHFVPGQIDQHGQDLRCDGGQVTDKAAQFFHDPFVVGGTYRQQGFVASRVQGMGQQALHGTLTDGGFFVVEKVNDVREGFFGNVGSLFFGTVVVLRLREGGH